VTKNENNYSDDDNSDEENEVGDYDAARALRNFNANSL